LGIGIGSLGGAFGDFISYFLEDTMYVIMKQQPKCHLPLSTFVHTLHIIHVFSSLLWFCEVIVRTRQVVACPMIIPHFSVRDSYCSHNQNEVYQ